MNQNSINNFIEKVTQRDFWNAFNLSKIPQKFKSLGRNKKNRQISWKTYNQIISLFLDIHYNEIYFIKKPSYFFLGGMMEVKIGRSGMRTIGRKVDGVRQQKHIENPISLVWTDLWFKDFKRGEIKYVKIKGSNTKSNVIEQVWKNNNNFEKVKIIKSYYKNKYKKK